MKILVIGSGAREHSLCYAIKRSSLTSALYAMPGNYGISEIAKCIDINISDFKKIYEFIDSNLIDLVVVGPEEPLVNGIVNFLSDKNIKVFGPDKFAAQLEGSKGFMKDLCKQNNIPTAAYEKFSNLESAMKYLENQSFPIVIKANGLAAGKGVTIAEDKKTAKDALQDIFNGKFGPEMDVVIEEFMDGEEASYFVCCDGKDFISLESAQDHKRIGENDEGPNTGGMGAYSPAPIFTDEIKQQVDKEIIKPTLNALAKLGHPYKGVLYAGLMIQNNHAKLVEYNIRFGDPECQVLMLRMKSDIVELMLECIDGEIKRNTLNWENDYCATVVMASDGYPGQFEKRTEIKGLDKISKDDSLQVFHASTIKEEGKVLANGGRVLSVTGKASSLSEALNKTYYEINKIDWPKGYYRRDIGQKGLR